MKKSLIALAFGTLALGMSEFVMMGILPDIARSLGVSIPEAGHLISAYALGVCFGAPLMVLVARKRPLKQILLALTAMIAAGNLCASLAPDYWSLLGLRFVSGLPHGAFFGVGSIVAERVADAGKRTEAVSIMIVGMTVANLFGVPLGTYISNVLTWRATFGIVAVWGVVALLLVRLWVPRMEPLPDTGLKGQFRFLRSLAPWLVLLSVMLGNGGIFCWYSYVSPLMIHASGFTADDLTLIIMLAGFGMFAGIDGYQVCRELRATSQVPIIMLSAKGEIFDKVLGLELGADDYMIKPFDSKELVARVKAVLRRYQAAPAPAAPEPAQQGEYVEYPDLTVNLTNYAVTYCGHSVEMPPKELELLYFLASSPNQVFTREQLLDHIWGYEYIGDTRTVDVHVKRLREKIKDHANWSLATVWGIGYKFEVRD